jgi:hypothetical protein
MKPALAVAFGSAFFKKPIVIVSPRMIFPSVRTRRNSESRVNRRDFGKRRLFCTGRILVRAMWIVSCRASASLAAFERWQPERLPYKFWPHPYKQSLPPNCFGEDFAKQRC